MRVLVDYDNVERVDRKRGPLHVVHRILVKLPPTALPHGAEVMVRLYGGWYKGNRLSRRATELVAAIGRHFPAPLTVSTSGPRRTVRVRVELARSLSIDPAKDLFHTFRPRNAPSNLSTKGLPFRGCSSDANCVLSHVPKLVNDACCPQAGCKTRLDDVLTRPEQKLVDTMLTADLIHAASEAPDDLAVVSTDDDLWPGIRTALHHGATVHHVHPRAKRSTPEFYSAGVGPGYLQYNLS